MHYVNTADGGLQHPGTSITGDFTDTLLDTGWDVHWDGPGHVYLSDRDLVDVVVPALERDVVKEALASNGWIAPDATAAEVAKLEQQLAATQSELQALKDVKAALETLDVKPKPAAKKSHAAHAKKA